MGVTILGAEFDCALRLDRPTGEFGFQKFKTLPQCNARMMYIPRDGITNGGGRYMENSRHADAAVARFHVHTEIDCLEQRLMDFVAHRNEYIKESRSGLGVTLVRRKGRAITLTAEGELLARDLDIGFAAIRRGLETLEGSSASRPVQISMSPAFAVEWLMPRIVEFQNKYPDITLLLNPTAEAVKLRPGGIDIAIRYRARDRVNLEASAVLISDMVVIGAPQLIGKQTIEDAAALVDMPWLQELDTNEVAEWMVRRGVIVERPRVINHMPGNLIMQAVRRGDGITYTARAFFQEDIRSGRIVVLHSEPAFGYYIVEVSTEIPRPPVRTFLKWLRGKTESVTASL